MSAAQLLFKPTSVTALSGNASVALTLGSNPLYMVGVESLVPGTDASALRVTLNAFAADYEYHNSRARSNSTVYAADANSSAGWMQAISRLGTGTGEGANMSLFVPNASNASLYKPIWGAGAQVDKDGGLCAHNVLASYYSGATTALTSLTLAASSGTLATGNIRHWEFVFSSLSAIGSTFGAATLLQYEEADGDANLDFDLTGGYDKYLLVQLGVVLGTDNTGLYGRVGTAGGVKDADYRRHTDRSDSSSSSYAASASASSATVVLSDSAGNAAGENACSVVEIPNPSGQYKIVAQQGAFVNASGRAAMSNGAGSWTAGTDQLTTFRVLPFSGTITSGEFFLIGVTQPPF